MGEWLLYMTMQMILMSYKVCFMLVFVFLVRALLIKIKMPRRYSFFLWFIPFLHLLFPIEIESRFSFLPEMVQGIPVIEMQHGDNLVVSYYTGPVHGGQPKTDVTVSGMQQGADGALSGQSGTDSTALGMQQEADGALSGQPGTVFGAQVGIDGAVSGELRGEMNHAVSGADTYGEIQQMLDSLIPIAARVWLAGILVLIIYSFVSFLQLKRRLKVSTQEKDNIYLSDHISTAFVMGLLKTKIYLPSDISEEVKRYVIAHEKQHIRRKDHIVKILFWFITCVYWMNPLVWLAFYYFQKDMEFACDEAVIKEQDKGYRKEYANALLELSVYIEKTGMIPLAFSEKSPGKRIQNIAGYKNPGKLMAVLGILVILVMAAGLLTKPLVEKVTLESVETLTNSALEEQGAAEVLNDPPSGEQEAGRNFSLKLYPSETVVLEEEKITLTEIPVTAPQIDLEASTGTDGASIYYVDEDRIIFGGQFGLFLYSKSAGWLIRGVDLKAISCDAYCEISVLEDGSQVFLHPVNQTEMYVYEVEKNKLYLGPYNLEGKKLFQRKEAEYGAVEYEANGETRVIRLSGNTLKNLKYYEGDTAELGTRLFVPMLYPGAEYFQPEDFHDLVKIEFYFGEEIYTVTKQEALDWVEEHFSQAQPQGPSIGCPTEPVYFIREDGTVGKVHVATDSCSGFNTVGSAWDYRENDFTGGSDNAAFWEFFGDGYQKYMKLFFDLDV